MRKSVVKLDSNKVQGVGTWVKVSKMTVGEIMDVDTLSEEEGKIQYSTRMLKEHVMEWNWTDDEGKPLPQPKDDPAQLENLTQDEFQFLCEVVVSGGTELKN